MGMDTSRKGKKVVQRAIELYNEEINGKRLYTVPVIIEILQKEFSVTVNRSTVYHWLKQYDHINKVKREV